MTCSPALAKVVVGMEVSMKKSTVLRIAAIVILIGFAIVDAITIFVPIVAIAAIALLLFRPRWLLTFFEKVYEREDTHL